MFTDRDSRLLGNVNCGFFETLDVFDSIENWDENGDPGFENSVELSHPLNHPRLLLRHEHDDRVQRSVVSPTNRRSLGQSRAELFLAEN